MDLFSCSKNSFRSIPVPTRGPFLNVLHSSMASSTSDLSMLNVSLSLAASTRLWASSTTISRDSGSPGLSRLLIRLSRISGSSMWMYGAATTRESFIRAFLHSYGQTWSFWQNLSSSSDVGREFITNLSTSGRAVSTLSKYLHPPAFPDLLLDLASSHIIDSTFDGICSKSFRPQKSGHDFPLPVIATPMTGLSLEIERSSLIT